jgi:hypothetical protein
MMQEAAGKAQQKSSFVEQQKLMFLDWCHQPTRSALHDASIM